MNPTPTGAGVRQLSRFVTSKHAAKLRDALEFRNAHADVPHLPPCVTNPRPRVIRAGERRDDGGDDDDDDAKTFRCARRIELARWSGTLKDARAGGSLSALEGGGAALESTDGVARVVLSAHGLIAHVTYPCAFAKHLDEDDDDDDDGDGDDASRSRSRSRSKIPADDDGYGPGVRATHDYMWTTHTFAADACPKRWAHPVSLLTEYIYGGGQKVDEEEEKEEDKEEETAGDGDGDDDAETSTKKKKRPSEAETARAIQAELASGVSSYLPKSSTSAFGANAATGGLSLWVNERADPWWASSATTGYPDLSKVGRGGVGLRPTTERTPGATCFAVLKGGTRLAAARERERGGGSKPKSKSTGGGACWSERGAATAGFDDDDDDASPAEVVALLADADGDALVTTENGRAILHVPDVENGATAASMYASDAVPERTFRRGAPPPPGEAASADVGRVALAVHAKKAFALRAAAAEQMPPRAKRVPTLFDKEYAHAGDPPLAGEEEEDDSDEDPFSAHDADVAEHTSGEGKGDFTLYKDGRCRVKYHDRTILELSRDGEHAKVLSGRGETVVVRTRNPMAWIDYVAAAVDFRRWAILTPTQRREREEIRRLNALRVEAEISKVARMSAMISGECPSTPPRGGAGGDENENGNENGNASAERSPMRSPGASSAKSDPRSPLRERVKAPPPVDIPRGALADAVVQPVGGDGGDGDDDGGGGDDDGTTASKPTNAAARGGAIPETPPPETVEEAIARTSAWLEDVKGTLGEDGEKKTAAGAAAAPSPDERGFAPHEARGKLVMDAFNATEAWLKENPLSFGDTPPDF